MAECRSLIEFLRAFEHHRRAADATYARSKRASSPSSSSRHLTDFCDNSSMSAAVDALLLLAVLAALGFLLIPQLNLLILSLSTLLHPATPYLSAAALAGAAATLASAALAWALLRRHARRCGKPRCRGLSAVVAAPQMQRLIVYCCTLPPGPARTIKIKIGYAPQLTVLGYLDTARHVLEIGNTIVKARATKVSPHTLVPSVKVLALKVDFRVRVEVRTLLSFLMCFPQVETLHIMAGAARTSFPTSVSSASVTASCMSTTWSTWSLAAPSSRSLRSSPTACPTASALEATASVA